MFFKVRCMYLDFVNIFLYLLRLLGRRSEQLSICF